MVYIYICIYIERVDKIRKKRELPNHYICITTIYIIYTLYIYIYIHRNVYEYI